MIQGVMRHVARTLAIAFCWLTALYAFVASSAFAYLQFIKPRVFAWVGALSDWHSLLSCAWLLLLAVALWPQLRGRGVVARLTQGLMAASAVAVALNVVMPALPSLHDGPRSIALGLVAIIPIVWLAAIDHAAAWPYLTAQTAAAADEAARIEGRLFVAALGAALLLTMAYALLASVGMTGAFEPDLMAAGVARGGAASLLGHLLVFFTVFVVLASVGRLFGQSVALQYASLLVIATLLFSGLFTRFVGDSIGMTGGWGLVAALAIGVSVAATWGGLRLRSHAGRTESLHAGADVFLSPPPQPAGARERIAMSIAIVLPLAFACAWLARFIDWDFVLLRSGVVVVWIAAFALLYRALPLRDVSTVVIALVCGVPMLVHAAWQHGELQAHALDRYAVYNPSFRLADGLLREREEQSRFDRFLLANTGLTDRAIKPVAIDHVHPLSPVSAADRPHVFLFAIDSLRSDYLSPYNPAVHFTPRIAELAAANVLFPNAFTRYGGTGLSMPAVWAGAALAHKQYVLPFARMNALERLVDANGYRRIYSRDHITAALWTTRPDDIELDRGRNEMAFDFCGTVDELGAVLETGVARETPVFAQTRSLNLHVAEVRNGYVPPGKSYQGFEAPYAYRVERIDDCFGRFIDRLKALRLYDRSLVILTADHGELIGEDGRWGHSYHMFPQVIQVPLMMHLPDGKKTGPIDRGAVALSTDITPTVYSVLGYRLADNGPLLGRPLLGDRSVDARRGSQVLAASYGAVYAVVSRNGRRLYIADAIEGREHAYQRAGSGDLRWSEVPVDAGTRTLGQLRVRRHIDAINRAYAIDRSF